MLSKIKLSELYFKDTSFANLMTRRIFNVLLIANPYDAFMLEDDGRIDEKIFNEYASLSLRYPPRFTQVSNEEEAWNIMSQVQFDLVICMPGTDNSDTFTIARHIKRQHPSIPLVVLTPFSHGVAQRMEHEDLSDFEYVFCWLGDTDLLLSIIKLIEDKMNMEHDVNEVGVQMILLVEDSIRFYSSVLPNLYKLVLTHSRDFATEALNEHQKTLRMRGRPKIVLARSYEEAAGLYETYRDHILGVITDVRYPYKGKGNPLAGIRLAQHIRERDEYVPIIIQSSEVDNAVYAKHLHAAFIDKGSKKMVQDLQKVVSEHFGFGEFIFRNPETKEAIARVRNLKDLQNIIFAVPSESLYYHMTRNHISRWLYSRAMFPMAEFLKNIKIPDFTKVDDCRKIIYESILKYRKMKNQGIVAVFHRDRFDRYSNFARIGEGSLGGKGRGLAFIDNMIKQHQGLNDNDKAKIEIPKTVVLCTDIFDEFMETNDLYRTALSDISDEAILRAFLLAKLPERLKTDFMALFDVVKSLVKPARGLALPAVRRDILDLHGPISGRQGGDALHAHQGNQSRVRVSLLPRQQGVYAGHVKRHRRGKDGNRHPGGRRPTVWQPLLSHVFGRGKVAQLLPHRRRTRRGGGRQPRPRAGQIHRRWRQDTAVLAQPSRQGAADQ